LVIAIPFLSHSGKTSADTQYVPAALPSAPKSEPSTPSQSAPEPQSTQQNVEVATTEGLTAQLVFTQPCWIEVKVDGQPPFQATYEAGTSKEVKGISKIELVSVGNAGGLSVTLNGKAYPNLGAAGQVVRNVILTPDTLKSL
jgi:cytoskeleton protein RodZ